MVENSKKADKASFGGKNGHRHMLVKRESRNKNDIHDDNLILLKQKSDQLLALGNSFSENDIATLTALLFKIRPAESELMNNIDKKAQDLATYYLAAYSDSRNIELSLRIFGTVRSLVRYIVLMDRYFEVGNLEYKKAASNLLKSVELDSEGYMKYAVQLSFAQFWPFWDFEKLMKVRMLRGSSFDAKEIRHHNMFKSSDAPSIYARVLESELATFNSNVALLLHYNQALQDIIDDYEDLEEDLDDKMPNIFILGAVEQIPFSELAAHAQNIRMEIAKSKSIEKILNIVVNYEKAAESIGLPQNYEFLRILTKIYIENLKRLLTSGGINSDNNKSDSEIPALSSS
jgi:hypothetical protein